MAETDLVIKLIGEQKSVVENINAIIKRLDALSAQINKTAKGAKTGNEELGQSAEGMGKQTGDVYESISRKANKFQQILYMTGNTSSGVATKMVHYAGVLSTVKSRFSGVEIAISGVIAVIGLLITWVMKETEAEKEAKEIIKIKTKNVEELIKKTEEYTKKLKEKNTGQSEEVGITRDLTSEIADHEKEQSRLNDLIVWMNNLGAPKFLTGLGALEEKYKQQTKELKLLRDAQADYNQELEDNLFLQTQVDLATSQSKKDKRLVEDMKALKALQEKTKEKNAEIQKAWSEATQFRVELERALMGEAERLWYEYLDKVKEAENLKYKNAGEKEQTLYLLRLNYADKIAKAEDKIADNEAKRREADFERFDKMIEQRIKTEEENYQAFLKGNEEDAKIAQTKTESGFNLGDMIGNEFVSRVASSLGSVVSTVMDFVFKPIEDILSLFSMVFSGADVDAMKTATDGFVQFFENIGKNFGPALTYMLAEGVPRIITAFIESIPQIITGIIDSIPKIITGFIAHIPEIVKALVGGILDMLTGKKGAPILSSIPGVGGLFKGGFIPGVDLIPNDIPILGWLHEGGMIGKAMGNLVGSVNMFKDAMRAHSGTFLKPDEVPLIAQVGEAVLSRAGVAAAGGERGVAEINSGRKSGNVVNVNVQPQYMFTNDVRNVVDEIMVSNLKNNVGGVYKNVKARKQPGFSSRRK